LSTVGLQPSSATSTCEQLTGSALAMDFAESAERATLRATVTRVGARFGHHYFAAKARAGESATELWAELSTHGFAGVNISEEYGGSGGSVYDLMIVAEELASAGVPLMTLVVSPAVCGPILEGFGSKDQKRSWLTGIGSGDSRMAFAITEPDAGSNTHNLSTTATLRADGWHIRGHKCYISGVDDASAVLTVARTGTDQGSGRAQLSLFVVETDRVGLTAAHVETQVLATERQFLLDYDDVVVPPGNLVGEEGDGFRMLFTGLNPERIISASICCGIGRYALDKAANYARERTVWGDVPIGAHQGIAHPLARGHVALESARLMTQKAATLHEKVQDCAAEANMAKLLAAEAAQACLDTAIQTLGGNGMSNEFGLADLWGLTRLYGIAPVSKEMVLNYLAQHQLSLPRSY
jgi:alkylation response protein AidB-like acyl-CoA dehydrogenase